MKISLNWIKDFIDINPDQSGKELVEMITLSVCEVEGYEETGQHLKEIYVAAVEEISPHPDAEKLTLVTVDFGKGKSTVVCGAKNFKVGDKVPFVGEGTTLPGEFTIKKTKIRGIESAGMLCAEDELGFSDDHDGLMILPGDLEVGTTLDTVFADQIDLIMEVDNKTITHRPDLWGHYGFARELSTIFKVPAKPIQPDSSIFEGSGEKTIDVEVLSGERVPRFTGISVDNVGVRPSPDWLRHRLYRVGLRAISNMVDLTNYIMLELGQPMHAFDAQQIPGNKLTVKLADDDTHLMTLYKKEVVLDHNDLVIYDAEGPSTIAGVIGGLRSGVTDETSVVFLEAANWEPVSIRKTSTKIGLRTDASQRFEKALDPEMTELAIQRGLELLKITNPEMTIKGGLIDIVNKTYDPIQIPITTEFISRRLGVEVTSERVKEILSYLGFGIEEKNGGFVVDVPSHRRTKDVSIPEDLVEEIGRVYGYNNITPKAPKFPIQKPVFNKELQFTKLSRNVLANNGFYEIYNYPLTCQKTEDELGFHSEGIMRLVNPVADHQNQMRTTLLPHFMRTIVENQKRDTTFKMFEIGRTYQKDKEGTLQEPSRLVCGISIKKNTPGTAFYALKSDVIKLMSTLQIPDLKWKALDKTDRRSFCHEHIAATLYSGETALGTVFELSPVTVDQLGIKEQVCIADLDFSGMFRLDKKEYNFVATPKYPSVFFELSIVVPAHTSYATIEEIVYQTTPLVSLVKFLSTYELKNQDNMKSMSVSIAFQAADRTLNPDEVTSLQENVIQTLAEKGFRLREA